MIKKVTGLLAIAMICLMPALASAQLSSYSQDFEALVQSDPGALGADGWLIFANVFGPGGSPYLGGYGVFPAPNDPNAPAFCLIAAGQGGPSQGAQQLVTFSDYNNSTDHPAGNLLETNVFQEWTVAAADVGTTWVFSFDSKMGDLAGASTALAFIKTLDPNAGFAQTNFITEDMTSTPVTWTGYQLSITIDAGLVGQILQIGFLTTASNYEPSGVFYDNVNFALDGSIPATPSSMGSLKGQFNN